MGLPMPWGLSLEHPVLPLQLLDLPLAFTQNSLLAPDDFVKQAGERGVRIEPEHLLELHRRRALIPLLRIVQQPPRPLTAVPVAASAVGGYTEYHTPLDLVITAAQAGHLVDPGPQPFRRWDGGLPLPSHGRIHRYPSVFYSPYQLLATHALAPAPKTILKRPCVAIAAPFPQDRARRGAMAAAPREGAPRCCLRRATAYPCRPGWSPSTPNSAQLLPSANSHARAITSRQDCAG